MAEDFFGQKIRGLHTVGDTPLSTDTHIGVFALDSTGNYQYLTLEATTGNLKVTMNKQYAVSDIAGGTDTGNNILAVRDDALTTLTPADGDYVSLRTDSVGALWVTVSGNVTFSNSTIAVTNAGTFAVQQDKLDYTSDDVAIYGATGNQLAINSDGSINVSLSGAGSNNIYMPGSVTLVKDTINTVATETPATVTENIKAFQVSGAGLCEWSVKFGTTSSEVEIMHFWTTPSCPTQYIDIPDSINVTTAQTILIRGINREKAASPASDFTGYATIIRNA